MNCQRIVRIAVGLRNSCLTLQGGGAHNRCGAGKGKWLFENVMFGRLGGNGPPGKQQPHERAFGVADVPTQAALWLERARLPENAGRC
jgi:hypothetical protein